MKEKTTVKNNYEFRRLYQKGKSALDKNLVLYVRPNRRGQNRVGLTVSSKLGCAVVRNRVRRRLREIFRLNNVHVAQGFDFILVARSHAVECSYKELERSYRKLQQTLKLWEA